MLTFKKYLALCLIFMLSLGPIVSPVTAFAESNHTNQGENEEIKVVGENETITIDLVNPQLTSNNQADRPADTFTLFTRDFGEETTMTNEWGVEVIVSDGEVTYISESFSGNNAIPKDGYVISVIDSSGQSNREFLRTAFSVGDRVELENYTLPEVTEPEEPEEDTEHKGVGKVLHPDGQEIIVDAMNTTRNRPMIVLYTAQFGEKTGTNQWGREMVVDLNENDELEVVAFRDLGEGGASGIDIPRWGFVLSAFGEEQRELLKEGAIFNKGDIISLEDINLIQLDNQESFEFITVNPTPESNPDGVEDLEAEKYFPGLRGANQLLIYTSDWATETTGTNEYGYEVIVEGDFHAGTIVNTGGNNSYIPENGYVLSGHGVGASFLIANASVGSEVVVDEETKTVTIKTTPNSLMESVLTTLDTARHQLKIAEEGLYNIDREGARIALKAAEQSEQKALTLLDQLTQGEATHADRIEFLSTLDELESQAYLAYYRTFESRKVEGRAIWHRPTEKTLTEVEAHLDELKNTNFNLVFIETWNDGYSITESENELIGIQPRVKGGSYGEYKDLLEAYVEEGKKRGIEVHAWVQNYRVGHKGNSPSSPIIDQKPEWALIHYNGDLYTPHENNYVFMDPAIPEVQDFLMDYYKELVENYDIQGLQLDYIRYPVGHYRSDSGYGEYSMSAFKESQGLSPEADLRELLDRNENPDLYKAWNNWKVNNVNTFVKRSYEDLKAIDKDLILSTAIFENINDSIGTKNQDWPTWVQSGWVDLTNPMAYYRDATTVSNSVESMVDLVNGMALNYAGIAPTYMGLRESENATQTEATRLGLAQGSAIFASQNVLGLKGVQNVLLESTYRQPAVLPHSELAVVMSVGINEVIDHMYDIYLPHGKISEASYHELKEEMRASIPQELNNSLEILAFRQQLSIWKEQASQHFKAPADARYRESLEYLIDILDVRIKRQQLIEEPMINQTNDTLKVNQSFIDEAIVSGEFIVDFSEYEDAVSLYLSKKQAEQLQAAGINIKVSHYGASLVLPYVYLTGDVTLTLEKTDVNSAIVSHALSPILRLGLMIDGESVTEFNPAVILTYDLAGLDQATSIYHYNEEMDQWDRMDSSVSQDAITAELNHFSIFGVFSDDIFLSEESDDAPSGESGTTIPDKETEEDEYKEHDKDKEHDVSIEDDKEEANEATDSQALPNTATNVFNYVMLGLMMILVSGLVLIYKKKQARFNK